MPSSKIINMCRQDRANGVSSLSALALAGWGWWALAISYALPPNACYSLSPLSAHEAITVAASSVAAGTIAYILIHSISHRVHVLGSAIAAGTWFALAILHVGLGATSSVVPLGGILGCAGAWSTYRHLLFILERRRRHEVRGAELRSRVGDYDRKSSNNGGDPGSMRHPPDRIGFGSGQLVASANSDRAAGKIQ